MNKKILVIILPLAFALTTAVYYWYKPHRSIENVTTQWISAHALSQDFFEEETAANAKYLNKALTVGGVINELSENEQYQQVVVLQDRHKLPAVQFTLKEKTNCVIGDSVNISGFYSGYTLVVIMEDGKVIDN